MTVDGQKLLISFICSAVLAVPLVSFISGIVVFPVLIYLALALIANFLPIGVLAARVFGFDWENMFATWIYSTVIWAGCAHGLARWGDVARSMGSKTAPYLDVLFAPILHLLGLPTAF
jgi:hypothetical protein